MRGLDGGRALLQGKPAVLVLPTMREIEDMAETLQSIGLRCFAQPNHPMVRTAAISPF